MLEKLQTEEKKSMMHQPRIQYSDFPDHITLPFYLLSDLSKTGFHQKAQGPYKGASQVTKKRLTVQLNK